MASTFHHPTDVLRFATKMQAAKKAVALIIAARVTGGAMRATGAMMCVANDGETAGYISNGCVDGDIIFQAKAAIKDGAPRFLRYGEDSPFRDITLPCGGQIDLWVRPDLDAGVLLKSYADLKSRKTTSLEVSPTGQEHRYMPKLRLRIAGRGEAVSALARQARGAGFDVIVQSPDESQRLQNPGAEFHHLLSPDHPPDCHDDKWTAVIVMFHDHDWEPHILQQALSGDAFYIGAMGSPRTHALRKETLRTLGVEALEIDRIRGPIGLIPSMRDANLLALSTLAEIVEAAQKAGRL